MMVGSRIHLAAREGTKEHMTNNIIADRVEQARSGDNPYVIAKMASGWLVLGDVQPLPGYCVLLADPIVPSVNDLAPDDRASYMLDLVRAGDAVAAATGAEHLNYEILCNLAPALHAHVIPRYSWEEPDLRVKPPFMAYAWDTAEKIAPDDHRAVMADIKAALDQS